MLLYLFSTFHDCLSIFLNKVMSIRQLIHDESIKKVYSGLIGLSSCSSFSLVGLNNLISTILIDFGVLQLFPPFVGKRMLFSSEEIVEAFLRMIAFIMRLVVAFGIVHSL